jgi:predicted nuclease with TOPRIM domain
MSRNVCRHFVLLKSPCTQCEMDLRGTDTAAQEREAKLQAENANFQKHLCRLGLKVDSQEDFLQTLQADNARLTEMWKSAEDANIKAAGRLAKFHEENAKLRGVVERSRKALEESECGCVDFDETTHGYKGTAKCGRCEVLAESADVLK